MSETTATIFAVYLVTASSTQAAGTVVNRIVWDGKVPIGLPSNLGAVADPDNAYPRGSVYAP
ncbi:hypothetical protein Gbfr_035_002 [Gluconobacter frateurii M-2]|nr:hypothetical protein Gbfr_035_002 [Gluconobacter frateurii M-2]